MDTLEVNHQDLSDRVGDLEDIRQTATEAVKWLWTEIIRFALGTIVVMLLIKWGKMSAEQAAEVVRDIFFGG